jgi:hypothetical protein
MGLELGGVRVVQKVLYSEAVKRVVEKDGYRVRDPERIPVSRQRLIESDGKNMCFSKVGFLAFIAMVISCTAEMDGKSQKIEVVVAEVEKYLGLRGFTAEQMQQSVEWWGSVLPERLSGVGLDRVNSVMGCFLIIFERANSWQGNFSFSPNV